MRREEREEKSFYIGRKEYIALWEGNHLAFRWW